MEKEYWTHAIFPLGFEKIPILNFLSISLSDKPTHKTRALARATHIGLLTDTPWSGPYCCLRWWLEVSPVAQRHFSSLLVELGMGPPCTHWAQSCGCKKAGVKFQKSTTKGRTLQPVRILPEQGFSMWGLGIQEVWGKLFGSLPPFSFYSSQLWGPHLPTATVQSDWRWRCKAQQLALAGESPILYFLPPCPYIGNIITCYDVRYITSPQGLLHWQKWGLVETQRADGGIQQ